jgi:hypothetical protein
VLKSPARTATPFSTHNTVPQLRHGTALFLATVTSDPHTYVYTHMYRYICDLYLHVFVCGFVCDIHVCVCVCVFLSLCITTLLPHNTHTPATHTDTHTHTHTHNTHTQHTHSTHTHNTHTAHTHTTHTHTHTHTTHTNTTHRTRALNELGLEKEDDTADEQQRQSHLVFALFVLCKVIISSI